MSLLPKILRDGNGDKEGPDGRVSPWESIIMDMLSNLRERIDTNERELEALHAEVDSIHTGLDENTFELEDLDARVEEVEVGQGLEDDGPASSIARLRDYQIETEADVYPHEGAERVGVVNGVDMWKDTDSRHKDGMFFVSSEALRMDTNQFSGVWVSPSTLRDLASIAEIEMGERGGD